nr:hypothetical protein [Tanacetum cinerariifolium]
FSAPPIFFRPPSATSPTTTATTLGAVATPDTNIIATSSTPRRPQHLHLHKPQHHRHHRDTIYIIDTITPLQSSPPSSPPSHLITTIPTTVVAEQPPTTADAIINTPLPSFPSPFHYLHPRCNNDLKWCVGSAAAPSRIRVRWLVNKGFSAPPIFFRPPSATSPTITATTLGVVATPDTNIIATSSTPRRPHHLHLHKPQHHRHHRDTIYIIDTITPLQSSPPSSPPSHLITTIPTTVVAEQPPTTADAIINTPLPSFPSPFHYLHPRCNNDLKWCVGSAAAPSRVRLVIKHH